MRDLIEAALIQSANGAAWALAEHVGDGNVERFVALMNRGRAGSASTKRTSSGPTGSTLPAMSRAHAT